MNIGLTKGCYRQITLSPKHQSSLAFKHAVSPPPRVPSTRLLCGAEELPAKETRNHFQEFIIHRALD